MTERRLLSRRAAGGLFLLPLAACVAEPGGAERTDRGIGGTGAIADRGIGGTGIVGTVTEFGSIWVNGRRIELPEATPMTLEGWPLTPADLRLGHVVAALAGPGRSGGLVAAAVEARLVVAGPVQRLDGATGAVILGQAVLLPAARPEIRPGEWVAISGLRRADGTIIASRIDPWPAERGFLLRGVWAAAPDRTAVSGQPVALARDVAAPQPGAPVCVLGRLGAAGPVVEAIRPDPVNPFGGKVALLSIETYLDPLGRPAGLGALAGVRGAPGARVILDAGIRGPQGALVGARIGTAPAIGERGAPPPGGPGAGPGGGPGGPPGGGPGHGRGFDGAGPGGGGRGAGSGGRR
ncbi:MAG: DUF5666 domain-containing protein [Paracraurococcus sp.]